MFPNFDKTDTVVSTTSRGLLSRFSCVAKFGVIVAFCGSCGMETLYGAVVDVWGGDVVVAVWLR